MTHRFRRAPATMARIVAIGLAAHIAGCAPSPAVRALPAVAAALDRPEPGLQGQTLPADLVRPVLAEPYRKGVEVIGHTDLGRRDTNLQMAWVDDCAYVSSGVAIPGLSITQANAEDPKTSGVAVIDVGDPRAPRQVGLLQDKGSIRAVETLHAVAAPGRKVLAAGAYEARGPDGKPWLSLYDVSNCRRPKLSSEFLWPEKVHEVTISPNGRRVYATIISPFDGKGGIFVLDIADLAHPRLIGRFGITRPDGSSYEFAPHEVSVSADERRIYAGVVASQGGDLNRERAGQGISAAALGPDAGGIYIIDNSDIAEGRRDPRLRLVGTAERGGWHSVAQARIGGHPYLVGAGELGACPGAWPRITDVADEARPRIVGEFRLAMNRPENCPPRVGMEATTAGIIGRPGTATSHFNDVDSATDTRLGLFPFLYAGLRIVDLRDPAHPVEVGYFRPGDSCMSHVRYRPDTGHIWLACLDSGFHVLALQAGVRAAVGLPPLTRKGIIR